jgi:heat shock protein HtpX
MTTYQYQSQNVKKTIFILFLMSSLVITLGVAMSYVYRTPFFLLIALVGSIVQGLVGYYSGEQMAIASAGGVKVDEITAPVLYNIVDDIARIAGIKMPDLYISPDPSANAFACGRGPNRASVCVNQGLLDILNKTELQGVLAHEISHVKNKDVLVMTMAFVMSGIVAMLADLGTRSMFNMMPQDDEGNGSSAFGAIMMVFVLASYFIAPIVATMLVLSVSRSREYLADASAVEITRYPQGLISALEKLHSDPVPTEHFSTATNHFYIAPPKKDYNQKFTDSWMSTHPSLENRIKNLMDQDSTLK